VGKERGKKGRPRKRGRAEGGLAWKKGGDPGGELILPPVRALEVDERKRRQAVRGGERGGEEKGNDIDFVHLRREGGREEVGYGHQSLIWWGRKKGRGKGLFDHAGGEEGGKKSAVTQILLRTPVREKERKEAGLGEGEREAGLFFLP